MSRRELARFLAVVFAMPTTWLFVAWLFGWWPR